MNQCFAGLCCHIQRATLSQRDGLVMTAEKDNGCRGSLNGRGLPLFRPSIREERVSA